MPQGVIDAAGSEDGEVQTLRRALRDVAALAALPALWVNADVRQIAGGLADAVMTVLHLQAVYVVHVTPDGDVEVLKLASAAPPDLGALLRGGAAAEDAASEGLVELRRGLRAFRVGLGLGDASCMVVVGSHPDFPTEAERLSLAVAANQAAIAIQRATALDALRAERAALEKQREAVSQLNRSLATERDRLRQLFQQAPSFMAVLRGPDHVFELCNETYVQLAGARDFIGRPVREVLPELDRQGFCALLDRVYATGEPFIAYAAPVDVERVPGQAPERLYLDFIYQPIVDEQGRVTGIFAQGHDVTQQTLAAEHRQLLVNELNHRVKNTLATVQSLAHQTLRDADSLAAAKSMLTARLLALSNAHNVLTRENWEGASLPEVVHEATRAHDDPAAPRIDAAGPDLRVGPRVALALSMALHELATNAAKYGALSTDAGAVQVRWERSGERSLALTWRERGGPPVSPPKRRGFGSRLLSSGLSAELGSAAVLDFGPTGLTCRITAPLSEGGSAPGRVGRTDGARATDPATIT